MHLDELQFAHVPGKVDFVSKVVDSSSHCPEQRGSVDAIIEYCNGGHAAKYLGPTANVGCREALIWHIITRMITIIAYLYAAWRELEMMGDEMPR